MGVSCGFYEFKGQLICKNRYGSTLVRADRFYPNYQICSYCGQKQKMPLHKRTYEYGNCGVKAYKDCNAAVNLENYVLA
jgi:Transposase and inactivated derivatives